MEPLQLKAQMMPGTRRADGSVTLKLVTAEEIDTELFAHIDQYRQQTGWLLFRPNQFEEADIPDNDAEIEGKRTLAETMKRSLYKLFMLQGGHKDDFHTFYREQMTKFQNLIGDKIEELEEKNGRQ